MNVDVAKSVYKEVEKLPKHMRDMVSIEKIHTRSIIYHGENDAISLPVKK